ncbi:MAG: HAD family hydrolase [Proteobacteria bacterium]|nr:HAD family hydrolase [Pseudomonadota bacterium]
MTATLRLARPQAILFDWDNTLVDNWPAIATALNAAFAAFGRPTWTVDEAKARLRRSLRDTFPEMFGQHWADARDIFYRSFRERHLETLRAMPGADVALRALAAEGLYLGVVSNKTGPILRSEAAHLQWDRLFGRLVGATDAPRDKPDPAPVHMALAGSGVEAGPGVWFVGDTAIDMECAANATCIGVLISPDANKNDEFQLSADHTCITSLAELVILLRGL